MNQEISSPQTICRTCLRTRKGLFSIFEYLKNDKLILDKLTECTTIKVLENDELPINICKNCLEKLNSAYDFRTMVIESNRTLYEFYSTNIKKQQMGYNTISNKIGFVKEEPPDFKLNNELLHNQNKYISDGRLVENKDTPLLQDFEQPHPLGKPENTFLQSSNDIDPIINKRKQDIVENDSSSLDSVISNSSSDSSSINSNQVKEYDNKSAWKNINEEQIISRLEEESATLDDNTRKSSHTKSLYISEYERLKANLTNKEKSNIQLFCKECNKSYRFNYYFYIHLPMHIGKVPYKCDICSKSYPLPHLLKVHKRKHSDSKPYSCKLCEKNFKYPSGLQMHKTYHSDEYPYKCSLCEKTFKVENSLKLHLRRHNKDEKQFVCEVCGKSFIDQGGFHNHTLIHNTERSFVCTTCGKSYTTKKCLTHHIKSHVEVKPHACSHCDKRFACKEMLKRHLRTHTGEKPYPCKVCGKMFSGKGVVTRHMRIHTGETPYPCKLCSAKFKYSHHLQNHVKVHHK